MNIRLLLKLLARRFFRLSSFCKRCGKTVHDFSAPEEIWRVIEKDIKHGHVLCYDCFCELCAVNNLPCVFEVSPIGLMDRLRKIEEDAIEGAAALEAEQTENVLLKQLNAALRRQIGVPDGGSRDERYFPRASTWIKERENWEAEVRQLREDVKVLRDKNDLQQERIEYLEAQPMAKPYTENEIRRLL